MEVVSLLADVVNPWDVLAGTSPPQIDTTAKGTLKFVEIPNSAYLQDLPSRRYRTFINGNNDSSLIPPDGGDIAFGGDASPLELAQGKVGFALYSVAPPRFDAQTGVVFPTLTSSTPAISRPYTTTIKAALGALPDPFPDNNRDGIALAINLWVDERAYLRTRSNTTAGWAISEGGNLTTDWLEMRGRDYLATSGSAVDPEADEVLQRPQSITADWTLALEGGLVDPNAPDVIRLNPALDGIRYDLDTQLSYGGTYHGLLKTFSAAKILPFLLSHEARHSWQHLLKARNGLIDDDGDHLVATPPASSFELTDASYPTNPEFSFLGDGGGTQSRDDIPPATAWHEAMEHNADRFAIRNVAGCISCADNYQLTGIYDAQLGAIVVYATYSAVNEGGPATAFLAGRLVAVATATQCTETGWTARGYQSSQSNGIVTISSPTSSTAYRLTLVNPVECAAKEVSTCVQVP